MKPRDYRCTSCDHVTELWIEHGTEFPAKIKCEICGKTAKKMFFAAAPIVKQGRAGNYKNGYTSNKQYIKKT